MKKILIVEDDAAIALGLESALHDEGYETHTAHTGPDGYRFAKEHQPDLIVLDLMLPGMSGLEICKRLRDEGIKTPVIMLTSKTEEDDKVLGLELGADDYVTKPFSLRELLARVRAHLRREEVSGSSNGNGAINMEKYSFGNVVVDFKRHEVYRAGQLQELTNREFRLLEYFIQHPGELITRDRLLDEIWGYDIYPTTRTVDNHILRLRKHIEPDPENPRYIKTVRGAGYLFEKDSR
ncbi:MAG: response regulator transcription factor [candidate division KSB1 bacterium]|nr:response regulator transcription factor [candidate division KSB1 bacterium]MDZ7302423.1 response regulator transcription factor [candidate division KSB1 bacterium]MDZ7311625.1 response regulator transcription factor [candidate division KSB1 bacterium]